MNRIMHYDETYAVEVYDHVEAKIKGQVYDAVVTRLHPRLNAVIVRYLDHLDCRRDGESKCRSARVGITDLTLMGRDG